MRTMVAILLLALTGQTVEAAPAKPRAKAAAQASREAKQPQRRASTPRLILGIAY